jgi:hypothetical protein
MDLGSILTDLKQEKDRISRAITELEGKNAPRAAAKTSTATSRSAATGDKRGKGLTPEGRKRLSLAMKKRWAERRKKAS